MTNYVTCRLCNKKYKNKIQYSHLKKFHGITRGEYENMFGKGSADASYTPPSIPIEQQITCKVCNTTFKNMITPVHLKTHGLTVNEYKEKYKVDSITTDYYRNKKSDSSKGKNNPNFGNSWTEEQKKHLSEVKKAGYEDGTYVPHNKGVAMSEEQRNKLSDTKKELFASGKLVPWLKGKSQSEEVKKKISDSVKEYAKHNSEELSERAKKAYQTRIENGTTFKFTGEFTPERKKLHREHLAKINREKSKTSHEQILEFMTNEGYIVKSLDQDSKGYTTFICNCGSGREHTTTRQLFHPSKYQPYDGNCRFCDNEYRSKGELEIGKWIESLGFETYSNCRNVIYPHEIDIYIPEKKVAIEFNGLYWHSELVGKDKHYHNKKRKLCEDNGIRLIQVMEDEWYNKPHIVKSILENVLYKIENRVYARKCKVGELSVSQARKFVDDNHISGYHSSSYKFGLFHDDELVSVMTFSKGNYSRKNSGWEIDRFCTKKGYQVVGGASKLFKAFLRVENPIEVISYADLRYGTGKVYEQIGFTHVGDTSPNYWYFKDHLKRHHRFSLRKGVVEGDDPSLTEWENRINQGWNRIWDCGSRKYLWKRQSI